MKIFIVSRLDPELVIKVDPDTVLIPLSGSETTWKVGSGFLKNLSKSTTLLVSG
jgi:hypothetical protein